jgi:hypothetical protein
MNDTTNLPAAPASRPAVRRVGLVALVAAALSVVACTSEQRRDLGEEDTRDALTSRVEQVVADQGLELDGDLTCTATITTDGVVTTSCDGTTTSGALVAATFDGTADVDEETCSAQLVVQIDGAPAVDEADVDCFDAG